MSQPLGPGDPTRLGRYELLGILGRGGMGTVYLGDDGEGRRVAIKMVRPEFAHDEEFRGRFRSEVTRAQQVPPFSTAEVIDADPEHDPPYLVVEYVEGPSLSMVVKQRGPLTGAALHGVAVGMASALSGIHSAGVIHRDLKPGNVLIAMGGIKVIDFGIARAFEATSKHTRTDQLVGTVSYMAPERFDGDESRPVGPASDIFAWGAVVMYAGTGRTPFHADSPPATAMRILTGEPDLAGLPEQLKQVVARALAKDPRERPTARELLDLLVAGGTGGGTGALAAVALQQRPTAALPTRMPVLSRRAQIILTGTAALLLLVGASLLGLGLFGYGPLATGGDTPAEQGTDSGTAGGGLAPAGITEPITQAETNAAILRGERQVAFHVEELDKYVTLGEHDDAVSAAAGATSVYALLPVGVDYQIRLLDGDSCLGVKLAEGAAGSLTRAACEQTGATVFSLVPTGAFDSHSRPTYTLRNENYGALLWEPAGKTLVVGELGGWTPNVSISLVDRGAL
jgi:eukaryotic-like serine/threonine-protein kinase